MRKGAIFDGPVYSALLDLFDKKEANYENSWPT